MPELGKDSMFGVDWETSPREYGVEKTEVMIPVEDGTELFCELFLPDGEGEFPLILGTHPYSQDYQTDAPLPISTAGAPGWAESGDPQFYVRRGYAMANVNVRGIGKSGGYYQFGGTREVEDIRDAILWLADQDWCDGNIGGFGMSYYAMNQFQVAMLEPEPLKCLFAPYGLTDWYRYLGYHGGMLAQGWVSVWSNSLDNIRMKSEMRETLDDDAFDECVKRALRDEEIFANEAIVEALNDPEKDPLIVDIVLNHLYNDYWKERTVSYENTDIPAYIGADWNDTALHLPPTFQTWEEWEGPTKMVVGPQFQPDRPLYQFQYESLRWFDHWLKDMDTRIMEDPDIRLYIPPDNTWKTAEDWPLPETKWTPFFLHSPSFTSDHESGVGLLSEHEIFEGGGTDAFSDSPFEHGALWYETAPMVEETGICGPILFNLYASTTATDELFFVTLYDRHPDGTKEEATRGYLRGSQRKVDEEQSKPWRAYHAHDERQPLSDGEVYEFNINVGPTARRFKQGHRLGIRIKCSDDDEGDGLERISGQSGIRIGHIENQTASRITVYRDDKHPSHLMIPVVEGNVLETYLSGNKFDEAPYKRVRRPAPYRKISMEKRSG